MGLLDRLRQVAKENDEKVEVHDQSVDVKGKHYTFRYGTSDAEVTKAILESDRLGKKAKKKRDEEE